MHLDLKSTWNFNICCVVGINFHFLYMWLPSCPEPFFEVSSYSPLICNDISPVYQMSIYVWESLSELFVVSAYSCSWSRFLVCFVIFYWELLIVLQILFVEMKITFSKEDLCLVLTGIWWHNQFYSFTHLSLQFEILWNTQMMQIWAVLWKD